mgnify:FL=1
MDPTILYAAAAMAVTFVFTTRRLRSQKKDSRGRRIGSCTRARVRRSVESVYHEIGDVMFRRAYRMTYGSFQELHRLLQPEMQRVHKQIQEEAVRKRKNRTRAAPGRVHRKTWKRYVPNGGISTAARLAIALRFFAGGDIYDVAPLFGVGNTDAFYSVWIVVEAVHRTSLFNLIFPQDHDAQRTLAQQFRMRSQAGFDCCVGAVDGILIWILQPKATCCKESKCDATKFFCGRKHKFGLNCQAVSDCRGRFLDMSIRYPASTSDCLAFESSALFGRLQSGLLAEGLCIFGDNAYLNSPFLATPYPNVSSGYKDAYNFFHSQLRIKVECAFGMFVQRWGVLRSAIPSGISVRRTTALVLALAKIHNFCIDQTDTIILSNTAADEVDLMSRETGSIPVDVTNYDEDGTHDDSWTPSQLLGGSEHFDDVPRQIRVTRRRLYNDVRLPRERLAEDYVKENNYRRPRPRGTMTRQQDPQQAV